jgi:hypothetical protein
VPALLVLSRAGQGDEERAAAEIERLVRAEPDRWQIVLAGAEALGGPAAQALEAPVQTDDCPIPLDTLSSRLPYHASGLWRLALLTDERRLTEQRVAQAGPAELGTALVAVSERRRCAGDRAGDRAVIDEAVTLYRQLATANPAAFTPDLAGSLNTLAMAPSTEPMNTSGVSPANTRSPENSTLSSGSHAIRSPVVWAGPPGCSTSTRRSPTCRVSAAPTAMSGSRRVIEPAHLRGLLLQWEESRMVVTPDSKASTAPSRLPRWTSAGV